MSAKITDTAMKVLRERYFLEGESEWEHLVDRVSNHFAKDTEERVLMYRVMLDLDFLPNSPALMNAGTAIDSHSACFVLPVEDSIESIYKFYSDAAIISKSGGGVGCNYSSIRNNGSVVNSTDGVASGPLSFMKVQDVSTDIIKQGGRRRGANMGILSCEHPDVWKFIAAKDTEGSLENFNLSVGITDEFMECVTGQLNSEEPGGDDCSYYDNLALWDELVQRAWSSAEPGVLFMDTIEAGNLVPELGRLDATNPCSEQPLLPYESCTLGSINLSNHVKEYQMSEQGGQLSSQVDWSKLKETTRIAVLFLNRILDKSVMPIPECQVAMELTRKIGLGFMGLADVFIYLNIAYDSEEARELAAEIQRFITKEADLFSRELGDKEGYYAGYYVGAPRRRNAHITTQAPTGTLSTLANCASGVEPYFAPKYTRKNMDQVFTMYAAPVKRIAKEEGISEEGVLLQWPHLFKSAEEIHWKDHIDMVAAIQNAGVDSSISKTINMSEDCTREDIKEAYERAYKSGCKGITVYRSGSRDACVLSTSTNDDSNTDVAPRTTTNKAVLGDTLSAKRYIVRVDDEKVYIIIAYDTESRPMEVFTKFPYEQNNTWNTLCRQLSLSLRYGVPLEEVIKQLEKSVVVINDVPSHLARILKMYSAELCGACHTTKCPECGEGQLIFTEGCNKCLDCGWSKCS